MQSRLPQALDLFHIEPAGLEQRAQASRGEAPVVVHREQRQLVNLDQERRRDDHAPARLTELLQVAGGAERIDDVLEHLLADHDVVGGRLLDRGADVELGEVEALMPQPGALCVGVAADLGCHQAVELEALQVAVDRSIQGHPLPLICRRFGFGSGHRSEKVPG